MPQSPHLDLTDPILSELAAARETTWIRRGPPRPGAVIAGTSFDSRLVEAARERFRRFAPWFERTFPETRATGGILESPLQGAPKLQDRLSELTGTPLPGHLWVKRDDLLPVSGSVKSRGGIHEILHLAEQHDPCLTGKDLSHLGVVVGSTGNLGLSIGITAAAFGFRTTVHMSADARAWKKDLLRSHGVEVIEHAGDFSAAVDAGRAAAAADPTTHFVDDESSLDLFAGYAVAAKRLRGQLEVLEIRPDAERPLVVHLPCGVGGAPGGITYGLKREFGDAVRCVIAEPTHAPAMFAGVLTGHHDGIAVQDLGLDGRTAADGLAVGRPSRLVGEAVGDLFDAFITVDDDRLRALVALVEQTQGWRLEPSATAGFVGPWRLAADGVFADSHHVVWSTGGSMVPPEIMDGYVREGEELLPGLSW